MEKDDIELKAMQEIVASLQNLDSEGRERVLTYVYSRLGIAFNTKEIHPTVGLVGQKNGIPEKENLPDTTTSSGNTRIHTDIRSLKELKKPSTAVEMAVLMAYYLEEFAPEEERKSEIGAGDITRYFKQAGFPLPRVPSMTLVHAKNAGYFESIERGLFKLNPVGYNLAEHTMGRGEKQAPVRKTTPKSKKKVAKKNNKK